MAKVEIKPAVTETSVTVIEEEQVVLTLSPDEARALHALTGSVSGGGVVRDNTASVFYALEDAGVKDKDNAWYNSIKRKPYVVNIATYWRNEPATGSHRRQP